MKIINLILRDFRCFNKFEIEFSADHNLHVIIAENMVGKTGLLAALRLAANTYTSGLKVERQISKTDHRIIGSNPISDQSPDISIEATVIMKSSRNKTVESTFLKYKNKQFGERTKIEILKGLDPRKESRLISKLVAERKAVQPLLSFIGTEYIHVESSDTVTWEISGNSVDGYKGCFEDKSIKKFLFKWLGRMDSLIAEISRKPIMAEQYQEIPRNAVKVFQNAVKSILPDIKEIEWNSDLKQPIVKLTNGEVRQFDVLSDGYRYLILLAGELATRSFILNKHLGDSVLDKIHGMVIIDEFGIHLHPSLQNQALQNLQKTFPEVQFIISTHSPLLINGLKREQVHIIQITGDNQRVSSHPDEDIIGLGANQILTDVFGLKTTMDNQFQDWNDKYTVLFNKKMKSDLDPSDESQFLELSRKLAPLRLDPLLKLVPDDPVVNMIKQRIESKSNEIIMAKSDIESQENIESRVDTIIDEIFKKIEK